MFFGEYDYDMDIAVQRGEAYEDGVAIGEQNARLETARTALRMGLPTEQIMQLTQLSAKEVAQLQ